MELELIWMATAGGLLLVGFVLLAVVWRLNIAPLADAAVAIARSHPAVLDRLGPPSWTFVNQWHYRVRGNDHRRMIVVWCIGPRTLASVAVFFVASAARGPWQPKAIKIAPWLGSWRGPKLPIDPNSPMATPVALDP